MGIDYRLTLAGDMSLDLLAEVAARNATELPMTSSGSRVLSSALYQEHGYLVTILAGKNGYYHAEDDGDTHWEWEPREYIDIDFDMGENDPSRGLTSMVDTVARLLAHHTEDAALVLNGNWLLLTRTDGKLRKHRPQWWAHYGLDDLIPW